MEVNSNFPQNWGVKPLEVEKILSLALGTSVNKKAYQDLVDWLCPLFSLPGGWEGTEIFWKLDHQFPKIAV